MNSNYGKGSSGSLKGFDFDIGHESGRPKSLNDQKKKNHFFIFILFIDNICTIEARMATQQAVVDPPTRPESGHPAWVMWSHFHGGRHFWEELGLFWR
ncbi:hypothetical protein HRI_000698100 [Hibiscus trionum]|uniref:Uncharacterized protein n=1 Tax=Hibiscus trionum TaxID=183268 RepID=A0A9W7H427_HIBTR|nr:hypothetical protein HRI_000698100 [Hibiscus trionum]